MSTPRPPTTETELMVRAEALAGMRLSDLAESTRPICPRISPGMPRAGPVS